MIEGKTIARVVDGDEQWIVFTDGSGIELQGWEDGGANYREVTSEEIAEHEAEIAQRELEIHGQKAYYESWMMRSCEERGELRAEWMESRPKMIIPYGFEDVFMDDLAWDAHRTTLGEQPKVKARCPVCNERSCPNAPYIERHRGLRYKAGTFTIPLGLWGR